MALGDLPAYLAQKLPKPMRFLAFKESPFPSEIFGNASFMDEIEVKDHFDPGKNNGFIIGPNCRLPADITNRHLAIVAPTGTGKSLRLGIQNILEAPGSVVVTDPSEELFRKTSRIMQARGYKIQVVRPHDPNNSEQFNPLKRRKNLSEVRDLAKALCETVKSDKEPYWTTTAITPLYTILAALKAMPRGKDSQGREQDNPFANLANARWMLNNIGTGGQQINHLMEMYLDPQLYAEYTSFMASDFRAVTQDVKTCKAGMEPWTDPAICQFTAGDTIDIDNLRQQKTIIYICLPERKFKKFGPIVNLLYSDLFTQCYENPKGLPVMFMLDEMGNLGAIENFPETVNTIRKYGCSIICILQNASQVDALYGEAEAEALFDGGIVTKIWMAGLGHKTTKLLSEMLGTKTVFDTRFGGIDDDARHYEKPLMACNEVRMLKDDEVIVICHNKKPALMKAPGIWENKKRWESMKQPPVNLIFQGHTPLRYLALKNDNERMMEEPSKAADFINEILVEGEEETLLC